MRLGLPHLSATLLSALCLLAGAAQAKNLIANGGFEKPATPAGGYTLYGIGQTIDGWRVVGVANSNLNTVSTSYQDQGITFNAASGLAYMDLTGTTNAATGVQQTIATTPGAAYTLSFSVGNVDEPGGTYGDTSKVQVYIGGTHVLTARNTIMDPGVQAWKKFSINFTATSTHTKVKFVNGDASNDSDCGLDDVSLVAK